MSRRGADSVRSRRSVLRAAGATVSLSAITATASRGRADSTDDGQQTPGTPTEGWTATVETDDLDRLVAAGGYLLARYPDELVGYDRATGEQAWTRSTAAMRYETAVHRDTLFLREGATLTAVDHAGEAVWRHEREGSDAVEVVFGGDRVLVGDDASLTALGPDGAEAWSATDGPTVPVYATAQAVVARANSADGPSVFAAYDLATGERRWVVQPEASVQAAISGERALYLVREETLAAVGHESGTVEWTYDLGTARFPSAVRSGDVLFVSAGPATSGIDPETGAALWVLRPGRVHIPFADGAGRVYSVTRDGTVFAMDSGGSVAYTEPVDLDDEPAFGDPGAVSDGVLYLARDGVVYGLDEAGRHVWERSLPRSDAASVGLDGDMLFALDGDTLFGFALDGEVGGGSRSDGPTATSDGGPNGRGTTGTTASSGAGFGMLAALAGSAIGLGWLARRADGE
ncbi:MAG: PQQ-binding-like beta-propeller repeat protein [Halorientalis sp.]